MSNDKGFDEWFKDYFSDELSEEIVEGLIEDTSAAWKHQQKIIEKKDAEIERLKKENGILKKAVRHYADTKKWGVTCFDELPDFQDDEDNEQLVDDDGEKITKGGRVAREALSEVESERML